MDVEDIIKQSYELSAVDMDEQRIQAEAEYYKSLLEWLENEIKTANAEGGRISTYTENELYYEGNIDIPIPMKSSVILSDLGYRANIVKAVVDAPVRFMGKNKLGLEVKLPASMTPEQKESMKENRRMHEEWLYSIFKDSRMMIQGFYKMLRLQGKKGEFAIKIQPTGRDDVPYKLIVLRPEICYPKFYFENNTELEAFVISYPFKRGKDEYLFAQVWTSNAWVEYERKKSGGVDDWEVTAGDTHNYGFIPIEWVRNKEDDTLWCESDIDESLKSMQDSLNKLVTDVMSVSHDEGHRDIIIVGVEPPRDQYGNVLELERGSNKIHYFNVPRDVTPQVFEIRAGDFDGLLRVIDKIFDIVSAVKSIPKNHLSRSDGGIPSGVAFNIIYMPFTDFCKEKGNLCIAALERIATNLRKMAIADKIKVNHDLNINYNAKVNITVAMPKDEKVEVEKNAALINSGQTSRKAVMQERGVEDVEGLYQEWLQEEADIRNNQMIDPYMDRVQQEQQENVGRFSER